MVYKGLALDVYGLGVRSIALKLQHDLVYVLGWFIYFHNLAIPTAFKRDGVIEVVVWNVTVDLQRNGVAGNFHKFHVANGDILLVNVDAQLGGGFVKVVCHRLIQEVAPCARVILQHLCCQVVLQRSSDSVQVFCPCCRDVYVEIIGVVGVDYVDEWNLVQVHQGIALLVIYVIVELRTLYGWISLRLREHGIIVISCCRV